jgi:hypothetical protein
MGKPTAGGIENVRLHVFHTRRGYRLVERSGQLDTMRIPIAGIPAAPVDNREVRN